MIKKEYQDLKNRATQLESNIRKLQFNIESLNQYKEISHEIEINKKYEKLKQRINKMESQYLSLKKRFNEYQEKPKYKFNFPEEYEKKNTEINTITDYRYITIQIAIGNLISENISITYSGKLINDIMDIIQKNLKII